VPTVSTKSVPRAHADRCAVCGRPLSKPGRVVPGIGVVGPECYRKFAAFERVLEAHGAEELAHGGELEVTERASPERIREVQALILRLKRAGLEVVVEDAATEAGLRAKRVRIKGVAKPKTFRRMFRRDVWSEWAHGVKLRALERELKHDMAGVA